jgi:transcriptional regulator with XRE-family HTH domain
VVRGQKNPLYYGLAERLRRTRRERQLGLLPLSRLAGVSHDTAHCIERNLRIPRIDLIEKLAQALSVSPAWLAFGEAPQTLEASHGRHVGVGKRLHLLRTHRGLSRLALAEAAALTGTSVLNIESGRAVPKLDSVERLAKTLGVSPSWLAFGVGKEPLAVELAAEAHDPR